MAADRAATFEVRSTLDVTVGAYARLAGVEVGDGFPVRLVAAVNLSPESFFAGSVAASESALRGRADEVVQEGADILDLGAMSTAPYLDTQISEEEEMRRLTSALHVLRDRIRIPISVDTTRSRVARAALDAGATLINDVTGFRSDPAMAGVAARAQGAILMACEVASGAADPIRTTADLLRDSVRMGRQAGIPEDRIVVDPGLGFFRQARLPWWKWDCEILRRFGELRRLLSQPILVGLSRKSFIGRIIERADPADRLAGSLAASAVAVLHGAHMLRTHDVGATRDAVRMAEALRSA